MVTIVPQKLGTSIDSVSSIVASLVTRVAERLVVIIKRVKDKVLLYASKRYRVLSTMPAL